MTDLPSFDDDGNLQVVVESPRGSTLKIDYDEEHGLFTVARSLPLGVSYPYDFGFVPSTRAEDGDPIDVMTLHDHATYPGIVLPCRILGMVRLSQKGKSGKRENNHRVISTPVWNDRLRNIDEVDNLDRELRAELAQFFLYATFFTGKDARVEGWTSSKRAKAFVVALARPGSSK